MKRSSLPALALAAPLALAWAIPCAAADATPPARSASASDSAASAVKHKRAKRKKAAVHKASAASDALPVVKLRPAPRPVVQTRAAPVVNIPVSTPPAAAGPSVIGPSTAASAGGPGFAVIANPVGAAASSPPRPDAGATTDPRMR